MASIFGQGEPSREEVEAERSLERNRAAEAVRRLLRAESKAVLSTLSAARQGWPFASLTPYALSREGAPILLLASIAQHTRNLRVDSRSSLFVADAAAEDDPQAGARVTVLGRVKPVAHGDEEDARARYLARHPRADSYFAQHDFELYVHTVEEARYIGGFGVMGWIPGRSVLLDPAADPLASDAEEVLAHVNEDHADALELLCRTRRASGPATLAGVDMHGFDVRCEAGKLRFEMDPPATTPDEVRDRFVAMVRAARARASVM